jgi:hypothetical protein
MCEHKNKICKLIQTLDGHAREDHCKDCQLILECKHFDLKKILGKEEYKTRKNIVAPENIDFDEFYDEF